ncbi:MAG: energy-coupling factor ABC transporter permease [Gemmataceae bacterium]
MSCLVLWAVHISDGVLSWPFLLLGFVMAVGLASLASLRLQAEEIPRIALLAAAFFVASSIHVKIGPTSVHLLLTGLVGVLLGFRAPLAVLLGITLQALLLNHGGILAIGVNACTEAIPALACGLLFALLRDCRSSLVRRLLVALGTFLVSLVFAVALCALATTPWGELWRWNAAGRLEVTPQSLEPLRQGWVWAVLGILTLASLAVDLPPRFSAGALAGLVGGLGTLSLTGLVLVLDGVEKWGVFVSGLLLVHLPLAVLEAVIVGALVRFLARVKPELIGLAADSAVIASPSPPILPSGTEPSHLP